MSGFIKLHRKLWEHPKAKDPAFLSVWVWMLCQASFAEHDVDWCGKTTRLKPGQFTAGRKQIALETGVHESTVNRIIQRLKIEQQIEQQPSNVCSLFSIVNWQKYQCGEQPSEQPANNERTTSEQPANTIIRRGRRKEDKKPRTVKTYPEWFETIWPEIRAIDTKNRNEKDKSFQIILAAKNAGVPETHAVKMYREIAQGASDYGPPGFQNRIKPEDLVDLFKAMPAAPPPPSKADFVQNYVAKFCRLNKIDPSEDKLEKLRESAGIEYDVQHGRSN